MKTITFPVGYRPGYLKQFLDSLAQQDISDYTIICSAENSPECIRVLEEHPLEITILRKANSSGQRSHSGARDNMYNVLNYAFMNGSDFNLHLEDDFALSPDAVNLASWYYDNYKDNPLAYICYGLFRWGSGGDDYNGLVVSPFFHGLGWCTFKEGWSTCFGKYWYDDPFAIAHTNSYGWDWCMVAAFKVFGYTSLLPLISRTHHIGRIDGTCCTTPFYDKNYTHLIWNQTNKETDFILRSPETEKIDTEALQESLKNE